MNKIVISKLNNFNEHNFQIDDISGDFPGFPDVTAIKKITVTGSSKLTSSSLLTTFKVSCEVSMLTSDLCEDIVVPLTFDLDLVFANDEKGDYPLEETIDIDEIIIGNVLAETPYTITKNSLK